MARSIKYANARTFGGFNPEVVAAMSFNEFKEAHKFWGQDRNMSPEKQQEELKSIYEKCKAAAAKEEAKHQAKKELKPENAKELKSDASNKKDGKPLDD